MTKFNLQSNNFKYLFKMRKTVKQYNLSDIDLNNI